MHARPSRRRLSVLCSPRAALALAMACAGVPQAASAAPYTFAVPGGGDLNISTNYLPAGTPGAADTVRLAALPDNTGFMQLFVAANQSIGTIESAHYAPNTIDAKLNGATPYVLTLAQGQLQFTDAITQTPSSAGGAALTSLFVYAPIAGGAGLTKAGPGFALLGGNNTYTGGTTLDGPGGLSVSTDANLGAAAGGLTFNNGGTLRALATFASARAINLAGDGRIESFGSLTLNGAITGSGPLTVGRFTAGSVTLGGVSSFPTLNVDNGNTVTLLGRLTGATNIRLAGTLNLGIGSTGPSVDAINDAATLTGRGGTLNVAARATNNTESLGTLVLDAGTTTLNLEPTVNGGIALNFASLTRQNRATLFVRGRDLGTGALATNRALIGFTNAAGLPLVGGGGSTATNHSIVPFLLGNANATGGVSPASVVDTGFVTLGANGLRPLSNADYATSLGLAAADNVRLSNNAFTQNTNVTVNSLLIRDTSASMGNSGVGGSGTITVTSGAIAAVSDLAGEELFIDNRLNFGPAEGVIHTAPTADGHSQLILRGVIEGSNGLTKSGAGDLYLQNTASTYTGTTTINGGIVVVSGNVASGAAGALGNSTTPIIISPGSTANAYAGIRTTTPLGTFARPITVRQTDGDNSLALLGTFGGYGTNFTGPIVVEGGYLNLLADLEPEPLTLGGVVSGAGGLQDLAVATPLPQYVRLTGNNAYAGGTVIRAGRWEAGSNTAFGSGAIYFDGNGSTSHATQTGAIQAFGAARTLANPLVFRAAPVFSGTAGLTFTGPVDLGSVTRDVVVTNSADTSFTGAVSRGGLVKRGTGRLILSGNNTYNGQTVVTEGILRATGNDALGVSTGQGGVGQATFIVGGGILELSGNLTSAEAIYFGGTLNGSPAPITSAVATGNLRSVGTSSNTLTASIAFDNVGTIGVDSGGTLTLAGETLDNTTDATATLRKVGAGTLAVKNVRLPGLAINAGTVRVTPAGAPVGTSRVNTLTVAAGATLDLTNNALILDYTDTSPQPAIIASLAAGRITTSVSTPGAAVGYAEAAGLFPGATFPQSYAGQAFDATTLILTQTLLGDANLDLTVDFADLLTLAQNYGATSSRVWLQGDFDYNGTVDFADLLALAQNYNSSAALDMSGFYTGFAADWALAQSLVPEPATLAAAALLLPVVRRRGRR